MDLKEYREQIDSLDEKILDLFFERMNIASGIAEFKKENGIAVFDRQREKEKLERIRKNSPEKMADYAASLYATIFELSRKHQSRVFKCGLLGEKLGHSFSPVIHSEFGRYSYALYERGINDLEDFILNGEWDGLNVTIPYKKEVIRFCSSLSQIAEKLGSVNTLVKKGGCIYGDNTDYYGFESMLESTGVDPAGKKAVVLGSGGASASICAVLMDKGASDIVVISRNGENNYSNIKRHSDAKLLVNTTPVGMYPENGNCPVDLDDFENLECVLDIIYNPMRTRLIIEAEKRNIICKSGLHMLVAQARKSSELFTGDVIKESETARVEHKLESELGNIILVGMPGCGKSTVAEILGKKTGRKVYETDLMIEEKTGQSIPTIIEAQGESGFRKYESEVIAEAGKMTGIIVSTGGGCVTVPENYASLHQNGNIFWLTRDIEKLPEDGRPLSLKNGTQKIYDERKSLYKEFADYTVSNDGMPEETAEQIERLTK